MEKLNKFDLNEEFERLWSIDQPRRHHFFVHATALPAVLEAKEMDEYLCETAKMFFNQGYENGYLDGLKDGRAL